MGKKIYAVKNGRKTGLFYTWEECEAQIKGYPGALHKSFSDISEAKTYLGIDTTLSEDEKADVIAYVDGSYDDALKIFSYGIVMIIDDKEIKLSDRFDESEKEMIEMRNIAGEITGAKKAMEYCVNNGYHSIDIYHDYEGIAKWCTGEWKANKAKTQEYRDYYNSIKDAIRINFIKVKSHSGDKYNDLADKLAKDAINGIVEGNKKISPSFSVTEKNTSKIEVFIDKENALSLINSCGNEIWGDKFKLISFSTVGNCERLEYCVLDKSFKIDFYFKSKGAVTIKPTSNLVEEIELFLKKLEAKCFKNEHKNASCKFSNFHDNALEELLTYIKSLESIDIVSDEKKVTTPSHRAIVLKSKFGDKITLRRFDNNNLQIQGNPAYILSQIMYYMSIQDGISEEEINNSQKEVYNSNISVAESRNILKERIPNAYDKIDDTIKKIISPAITLSNSKIEVEEYSCYVFPALKGLEAFLLNLLSSKTIYIDHKAEKGSGKYNSFGPVFEKDSTTDLYVIRSSIQSKINDSVYEKCLADIYNSLVSNRHTYFHANQILVLTDLIPNKEEADAILSEVFELIDNVASQIL